MERTSALETVSGMDADLRAVRGSVWPSVRVRLAELNLTARELVGRVTVPRARRPALAMKVGSHLSRALFPLPRRKRWPSPTPRAR